MIQYSSKVVDPAQLTPSGHTSPTPVSGATRSSSSFEIIDSMSGLELESRHIRLPCYLTKPHARNRDFFPRLNVTQLIESALISSESLSGSFEENLRTFVLCGMGGLGKTEIAMEFVFSHLKDFDAVFIFHADQASTLAEEYSRAAIELGLQQNPKADPQDSRELFKEWLADPQKSRPLSYPSTSSPEQQQAKWLILFDNADDPDILSDYWPTTGIGSVLVTSRNPMAKSTFFFGDTGHELETVSKTDGVNWIIQLSGADPTDPEVNSAAQTIAQRLDGLPLAITQITSIIRMRQLRLPEFIELYESETELAELQATRIGNRRGYEHSLASVWALGNLESGPMALLGVISMLDPDRVQEEILKTSTRDLYHLPYPTKPREYHRDLTPLLQSSLVQRNGTNAELRVHRLVTDVVRKTLQENNSLVNTFDLAVDLVSAIWPFWRVGAQIGATHNTGRWEQSGKLYPHVYRLLKTFPLLREQFDSLQRFERFADLIHEAAWSVLY
jgi:hypothetical protein